MREKSRPKEPWKRVYVKSVVYGGLDAIITCFSLISSISATRLSSVDVWVLGFANLVADGISMGFSDVVSAIERAVTEWDVANHEQMDLLHQHQELGMDFDYATTVVNIFAKYKGILVDEKMMAQKGTVPPSRREAEKPWKSGLITFTVFIIFGSIPLLAFIVLIPFTQNELVNFLGACLLSALALATLGAAKATVASQNYAFSVTTTLFNGAGASATAYGLGWELKNVAGL